MLDVTLRVTNILHEFEQVRNDAGDTTGMLGNRGEMLGKCGEILARSTHRYM
jgi:hypothetical protein